MPDPNVRAPGQPGILPRWTSSAKTGVGSARNLISRVWFTLSHGVLNEVYYPRVDLACTQVEVHAVVGHERAEALRDPPQLEGRYVSHCR